MYVWNMNPLMVMTLWCSIIFAHIWESSAEQCKGTDDVDSVDADFTKLTGKWYEFASFGMLPVAGPRLCHTAAFYPTPDGSYLAIVNDFVLYVNLEPLHNTFRWNVTREDPDDKKKLTVTMSLQMVEWAQARLRILETDYENFIIMTICQTIDQQYNFRAGMILIKQRVMEDVVRKKVEEACADRKISFSKFIRSLQEDCDDVTFPESVPELGAREPRLPRDALPSRASGRDKLYDFIPIKPFDAVSKRKSDD